MSSHEYNLNSPRALLLVLANFGAAGAIVTGSHNQSLARQLTARGHAERVIANIFKITARGRAELEHTQTKAPAWVAPGPNRSDELHG
jgi:hypothetical protein